MEEKSIITLKEKENIWRPIILKENNIECLSNFFLCFFINNYSQIIGVDAINHHINLEGSVPNSNLPKVPLIGDCAKRRSYERVQNIVSREFHLPYLRFRVGVTCGSKEE